jgi:hypothetical protein
MHGCQIGTKMSHCSCPITGTRILCMAGNEGPDVLLCMPNRTNCNPLVSVMLVLGLPATPSPNTAIVGRLSTARHRGSTKMRGLYKTTHPAASEVLTPVKLSLCHGHENRPTARPRLVCCRTERICAKQVDGGFGAPSGRRNSAGTSYTGPALRPARRQMRPQTAGPVK